ncbi:MAG TPA: GyrI-like domain-containing protein [Bacillota bacterium]|nr:GyrI-like domain-containing protein [Bacillota bacterium]
MEKVNYQKRLGGLYKASSVRPSVIETPVMSYIVIDGTGNPSGKVFQDAVKTLYPVAYLLKFMIRERLEVDYGVMPLEVQWKVDREHKESFDWNAMILQPSLVTRELFREAVQLATLKKDPPRINEIRMDSINEGLCIQMLHRGPYGRMNETLEKMLDFIEKNEFQSGRDTHDIYLNSIKKAKPENLKTIMRLPIRLPH